MVFKTENTKRTIFDKLYLYFFILLPFIYIDKLVDPVLIPRQIFLTVFVFIIGSIIFSQVRREKLIADFSFLKLSVSLLFALLILVILVSFFRSVAISESIYLLSKISIEFLFFIVTTFLLIQNQLSLTGLIKSIIVFSSIAVSIAVFQLLQLSFSGHNFFEAILGISATFGIKNLLASVLFLCFPFLLYAFGLSRSWKIIAIIVGVLSLLLIWLIQTKAVIIAIIIFVFILVLFAYKFRTKIISKTILKAIVISGVAILLVISVVTIQNREKFFHLFDKKSSVERLFIWDNSVQMIGENFIFGVGAGNWQVHFPKYGLDNCPTKEIKMGIRTIQRPHNDFLWIFCEMGVVGFLAYASIFILSLYYLFKLLRKIKDHQYHWFHLTLFAAILGYLIIAFVDFPLERIEHQVLLYLMFSIITAYYYTGFHASAISKKMILKPSVCILLLFTPVLLSMLVSVKRCVGEMHSQKIYYFEHHSNWQKMIKEANSSINYFYSMDPMSAPIEWYKGVALFSLGNLDAAQNSFEEACKIHPYNIHVLNNLASCYESKKEHDKAVEFYLKALAISSEFEEARLNISAVYFNMKEFEKAFETIDQCSINSTDPKYQLFLPAILNSWLEFQIRKQNDRNVVKALTDVKSSKERTLQLYFESKNKSIKFDRYILRSIN